MLDEKLIQAATVKAVFDSLDLKTRDDLLQNAILKTIETPKETGAWGRQQPSALQQAFSIAVEQVVRGMVFEKVKTDPDVQAQLQKIVNEATKKALFDNEEAMINSFATAISRAMEPKDER